jgi:hypothetical protein
MRVRPQSFRKPPSSTLGTSMLVALMMITVGHLLDVSTSFHFQELKSEEAGLAAAVAQSLRRFWLPSWVDCDDPWGVPGLTITSFRLEQLADCCRVRFSHHARRRWLSKHATPDFIPSALQCTLCHVPPVLASVISMLRECPHLQVVSDASHA